ncbi:MAG: DUF1295 domain-containing protein [Planctomycetota bacterium]
MEPRDIQTTTAGGSSLSVGVSTPSPFADPHYDEDAEKGGHVIVSHPTWSLEENQSALTGWIGAAIVLIGAALMTIYRDAPPLPAFLQNCLSFPAQERVLLTLEWIWNFRVVWLLVAVFFGMLLVETLVFKVQRRHFDFEAPRQLDNAAWSRIGARWLAMVFCVVLGTFLYVTLGEYNFWELPYKDNYFYARYRQFYIVTIFAIVIICIPYFWMVERYARPNGPVDEFLVLARCLRRFTLGVFNRDRRADAIAAIRNPHVHNLFIGLLVKFFFVPLMLTWCFNNWQAWQNQSNHFLEQWRGDHWPLCIKLRLLHESLLTLAVALDITIAVVGYLASLRLLDTQITSAEPTLLGWMTALVCYPPFLFFQNLYLRRDMANEVWPDALYLNYPVLSITVSVLILILIFIYTWATFSFGIRFSNLTNRGIICCGPYKYVRHPAYITKNLMWWLAMLSAFFLLPEKNLSRWFILLWGVRLLASNLIYGLRAWTEERHLMREPHYREYCKKVPWRFIPYVW